MYLHIYYIHVYYIYICHIGKILSLFGSFMCFRNNPMNIEKYPNLYEIVQEISLGPITCIFMYSLQVKERCNIVTTN